MTGQAMAMLGLALFLVGGAVGFWVALLGSQRCWRSLAAQLLVTRERLLDLIGDRYQERYITGPGDFEFGERIWTVGCEDFSYDDPPTRPGEILDDMDRAIRAKNKKELKN